MTSSNRLEHDETRYSTTVQYVQPTLRHSDSGLTICLELFSLEHITDIELACDGTTWLHAGEPEPIDYKLTLKLRNDWSLNVERGYTDKVR